MDMDCTDLESALNAQPKKLTAAKLTEKSTRGKAAGTTTRGRGKNPRGRNAGRPKKKTTEELDAEMTDYFGTNTAPAEAPLAATNGAAPAAAAAGGDDLGMDEIS
jgi:THO complex subunit 4